MSVSNTILTRPTSIARPTPLGRPPSIARSSFISTNSLDENLIQPAFSSHETALELNLDTDFPTFEINESSQIVNGKELSRPSLLRDIRKDLESSEITISPLYRSPWILDDASLRPLPPFYPPMNPQCTVFISDASPSTVASRIAHCLMTRSISAEFDDEAHIATCMTIDRVHFTIHLYRGDPLHASLQSMVAPKTSNCYSDSVLVEIVRQRGSNLSFHPHARAILQASKGLNACQFNNTSKSSCYRTSPFDFPRLEKTRRQRPFNEWKEDDDEACYNDDEVANRPAKRAARSVCVTQSFERALELIHKDRLEAQQLGLESLALLTDEISSGKELAIQASWAILGDFSQDSEVSSTLEGIQDFLIRLIRDRELPSDSETLEPNEVVNNSSSSRSITNYYQEDAHHGGWMRSLALRILANAITVLSKYDETALNEWSISATPSPWTRRPVVQSLVEDLLGGTRFPSVVVGTRLASVHEATLVTRCLDYLARRHTSSVALLEVLRQNQNVRHDMLVKETKELLQKLNTRK